MGLTYKQSLLLIFKEFIPLVAVDILDDDTQFEEVHYAISIYLHNSSTLGDHIIMKCMLTLRTVNLTMLVPNPSSFLISN